MGMRPISRSPAPLISVWRGRDNESEPSLGPKKQASQRTRKWLPLSWREEERETWKDSSYGVFPLAGLQFNKTKEPSRRGPTLPGCSPGTRGPVPDLQPRQVQDWAQPANDADVPRINYWLQSTRRAGRRLRARLLNWISCSRSRSLRPLCFKPSRVGSGQSNEQLVCCCPRCLLLLHFLCFTCCCLELARSSSQSQDGNLVSGKRGRVKTRLASF